MIIKLRWLALGVLTRSNKKNKKNKNKKKVANKEIKVQQNSIQ